MSSISKTEQKTFPTSSSPPPPSYDNTPIPTISRHSYDATIEFEDAIERYLEEEHIIRRDPNSKTGWSWIWCYNGHRGYCARYNEGEPVTLRLKLSIALGVVLFLGTIVYVIVTNVQ